MHKNKDLKDPNNDDNAGDDDGDGESSTSIFSCCCGDRSLKTRLLRRLDIFSLLLRRYEIKLSWF